MTDQAKQIEQLEQTVAQLKIRAFDAGEIAQQQAQQAEMLKNALVQIANVLNLQGEGITVQTVVDAVTALVPVQKEAEFEPVVEG